MTSHIKADDYVKVGKLIKKWADGDERKTSAQARADLQAATACIPDQYVLNVVYDSPEIYNLRVPNREAIRRGLEACKDGGYDGETRDECENKLMEYIGRYVLGECGGI